MKKFLLLMLPSIFKRSSWVMLLIGSVFVFSSYVPKDAPYTHNLSHPFFVSVTEFNHNQKEKIVEISCKMFADDFENALKAQYKTVIDITHPKDPKQVEKYVFDYLQKHMQVKINGKPVIFQFIGYEKEEDAVWGYLQINNVAVLKKMEVTNNILYETNNMQTSIMHATAAGTRKSTRLVFPDTVASFEWQ
ncbi:MAG: DUF6702 family protein [Chitinophagaceae bacterium]